MRNPLLPELEKARVKHGPFATTKEYGANGIFMATRLGVKIKVVASDLTNPESQGWEHVSVSVRNRTPTWPEMSFIKDLFWNEDELVVQFHPPKSEYVNNHPYVLHMWRNPSVVFPMPPSIMVGTKGLGELTKEQVLRANILMNAGVLPREIIEILTKEFEA